MKIKYHPMRQEDAKIVAKYIKGLFQEDPTPQGMTKEKIERTIKTLLTHKEKGIIFIIEAEKEIIGYATLINFWSNEYGGNIVYMDELFIRKDWRGKGIATNFIQYLAKKKINNAVAFFLEVTPKNNKAEKLYKRLGFEVHKNKRMTKEL